VNLTLADYYRGRDKQFASELTDAIRAAAQLTVVRANVLLATFLQLTNIPAWEPNPETGTFVNSGWRPAAINAATPGAAQHSRHLTGEAVDLYDPKGLLDSWCLAHQQQLAGLQLWLESPAYTPGWCHVQIVPPASGARVFIP